MKRLTLKIGDVFNIPIDKELVGYGQIIVSGNVLYIIVFEEAYQNAGGVDIDKIVSGNILLVGHTLDGRLYHGMWEVVGNVPISKDRIPFPCYKLDHGDDGLVVVDFNGHVLHPASAWEQELLAFRTTRAPIGYEHALQAKHGVHPWDKDDEVLTIDFVRKRVLGKR